MWRLGAERLRSTAVSGELPARRIDVYVGPSSVTNAGTESASVWAPRRGASGQSYRWSGLVVDEFGTPKGRPIVEGKIVEGKSE
jgi:hypothetical protein